MTTIPFDEFGPLKVIHLHSPRTGMKAVVVVDNVALGPAIGGVRVSLSVTDSEVMRLARTMTLKNAVSGLAHGGGKAGIIADPKTADREQLFRTFGRLIRDFTDYIPGPDMGSNEACMAWLRDETGRAVGLPEEIGGLPLDKVGATGFGLAECADAAAGFAGISLKNARVAVQGFGSVGKAAARFLQQKGAVVVALSDTGGTIVNPDGLDVAGLIALKDAGKSVADGAGKRLGPDEIFGVPCEILVPAATPDVITRENASSIQAKLVLQGANIPATKEAEEILHARGVVVVPDFIANAGGVIMAAMEYAKRIEQEAFEAISSRIRTNTRLILEKARSEKMLPRRAAVAIATARVREAMKYKEF
ncbi:MAG: Glu/Leu/Phe/Val dehydrogenase [Thermodesulfovibrionales bacterium]